MKKVTQLLVICLAGILAINSCSSRQEDDNAYSSYIKAYTGGLISENSNIKIIFSAPAVIPENSDKLFHFSPSIKGKTVWVNSREVEFIPENMAAGKRYKATFDLGKVMHVSKDMARFGFEFNTKQRELAVVGHDVVIGRVDPEHVTLYLKVKTSTQTDAQAIQDMVRFTDEQSTIKYCDTKTHDSLTKNGDLSTKTTSIEVLTDDEPDTYTVIIDRIERQSSAREVAVTFDGKKYKFEDSDEYKIEIPSKEEFSLLYAKRDGAGKISLGFSDPIDSDLSPVGLVTLSGVGRYNFEVKDNIITIYYDTNYSENMNIHISHNIRNYKGDRLDSDIEQELKQQSLKPEVSIINSGVIMPDSDNMILSFSSVNLSAVDISVVRIYEQNILSFLQTNNMDGDNELRRVGRLVYKKHLQLDSDPDIDLTKKQVFNLDMSGLFQQDKGSIYRVKISFNKDYSLYGKTLSSQISHPNNNNDSHGSVQGSSTEGMIHTASDEITIQEERKWDITNSYWYDDNIDWSRYKWSMRDNPDDDSYYMDSSRMPECNIIASNIGLTVQAASGNRLWVAVTDIMTGKALSGATVKAYNYQLIEQCEVKTDKNGFAYLETANKPFIVTATKSGSTAYLKTENNRTKSLSRFDIGGKTVEDGLKGFAYGERGVWRPGDTLHLSFILESAGEPLPAQYPVTLEVYNPNGQFYDKQTSEGRNGMYVFDVATAETDPTGIWSACFRAGGATFYESLRIETVKPNRLKIKLNFSDDMLEGGTRTVADFRSEWLTGVPANGLRVNSTINLRPAGHVFKGYEDWLFIDPIFNNRRSEYNLIEGKLDNEGHLHKTITLPRAEQTPGMMEALITNKVFEPGGDISITTQKNLFSPYQSYVGIHFPSKKGEILETDTDNIFSVVCLDKNGEPIRGHKLEYSIYKMKWSWWWDNSNTSVASYISGNVSEPVMTGQLISGAQPSEISFKVEYPDWGRYLIYVTDKESGHSTGGIFHVDWPEWRGRSNKQDPDALTMLTFSTDKEKYNVGETAKVYIPAAMGGNALVTIAGGNGVISREWVKTSEKNETVYSFKVTADMTPNCYIQINLIQPYTSYYNDLPIRMYGVKPIYVTDKASVLHPIITAPKVIRPQEEFTIKVREESNQSMTYTLAIVDEGLLDITNYRTPDPWSEMYAKEAFSLSFWDMYDEICSKSPRGRQMLSIGGDFDALEMSKMAPSKQGKRFKPIVRFEGPFTLKKGENTHKITLPMYVGSVRIMVVAKGNKSYGNAEKTVPVRAPLMILPTLPRQLRTGDEAILPVNVFAMEDNIGKVNISISAEGPVEILNDKQSLTFDSKGDKLCKFKIKAGKTNNTGNASELSGNAVIKVVAEANGHKAVEEISFTVESPTIPTIARQSVYLNKDEEITLSYQSFNNSEEEWAKISISSFPSVNTQGCWDYMMHYRYDCTEQICARGISLLNLQSLMPNQDTKVLDTIIPDLLKQLYARQLPGGGFTVWPEGTRVDEWITSMAGQFMVKATEAGYKVNSQVFTKWEKFQKSSCRSYRHNAIYDLNDLQQAYRLYSLVLATAPDLGSMNRLKESENLSTEATWRLASAYALTGKKSVATELVKELDYRNLDNQENRWYNFRDMAANLETLVLIDDMGRAMKVAQEVANELDDCFNTQTIAFSTTSLVRLAQKVNTGKLDLKITGLASDKVNAPASGKEESIRSAASIITQDLDPTTGECHIKNMSDGPVYIVLTTKSHANNHIGLNGNIGSHNQSTTDQINQTKIGQNTKAEGVTLKVGYTDKRGLPIDITKIKQGDEFTARLSVTNIDANHTHEDLVISYSIPSGWEILNERLMGIYSGNDSAYNWKDIRDARADWFFSLTPGQTKTFELKMIATYEGKYIFPSTICEDMYDTSVHLKTSPTIVSITTR